MTRNNRSAIFSRSLVVVGTALVVALGSGVTWAQTENEAPATGNRADGTVIARTDPGGDDFDALLATGQIAVRDDYGYAIVTADFNGDGFDDWAVGYPAADEVRVYFGGLHRPFGDPSETDANPTASPNPGGQVAPTVITGPAGSHFGHALAAGNVDGSGPPELVVGAPGTNDRAAVSPNPGQAYVVWDVSASTACPDDDCDELSRDPADERNGDHFGWSVAVIPLPGNPTIAVGAPRWFETDSTDPLVGRVEFFQTDVPEADATAEATEEDVAVVDDLDDRARLSRSSTRAARASASRFPGSRRFTARGRQGPGRDPIAPPFDGALAPSFEAIGSIIDPGGTGTAEFGEQLGESMAVCLEGGVLRLAVGAVAADAVRILNPDDGATVSTVLDPDLATIDAEDRPGGLFGSNVVCGNFNVNPGDELVVSAVLRDWDQSFYLNELPPVRRLNGGGVFLFDTLTSLSPTLRLLPQSSGEFLGYALAAGRVFTSLADPPSSDPYEALLVGVPRYDFIAEPVPGAPVCDLDYANGAVMMLDLANPPADPVVLTEANIADGMMSGFVRHRVIGTRCGQAGGAIAVGDLNNDGWADVLTSTNVDPNEDFLRPGQNPAGNAWIFSMNDADIDESDDGANIVDPDDDNDCFADAWEDRNADGLLDDDETGPFTPDINAVVSGLSVACSGEGGCMPGDQLNISMQLNRSCIAIDDDRVADGAANRARVTLTIDGGGAPISGDLSLDSTVPAGGVEDDTDPNAQVVTIDVQESDLTFPTALTASAVLDILAPVDAAFPDDVDIDVLVEVLDGSDPPGVILEARGTFGGNLVGRLDDNVDGPVNQTVDATPSPGVALTESACEFGNPRQPVACLPNAIVPGVADLFNDGLKNLPANFGLAAEFTTAGFATGDTFRCPGGTAANCFPNADVDCTGTSQDADAATCVIGQQLVGATSQAAPALSNAIELEILDDPNLGDGTDWPASVIAQTRVDPAGGGSVPDAAPPTIPVARPKATMDVVCDAPCTLNSEATFSLAIQNVGAAGSGPATVLFTVPESTCDADQDPIPAPAPGTCQGAAAAGSPAVGLTCDAIQLINGVPTIPCTFNETTPSSATPVTIEFDLTVTDPRAGETASATVYYPQCADNAACPDAGTVVSRSADATLPLQAPFIQDVTVSCESGDCLPNGAVTYEIEIRNSAAAPADTTVLVPIPAGTTCVGDCSSNVGTGDTVSCVRSNSPDRLECAVDGTRRTNPTTFDVNLTIDDPPGVTDFTATVDLYLPQCTGAGCDAATPTDSTSETLPIATASVTIEKSALPTTYALVDDVIAYSYLVTNTGDVTISGPITIDDDTTTDEACPAGDLAPAATTTCTSSYAITQADLDAGSVTNVASASGTDGVGNTITSATDTVTVTAVPDPELTVEKSANPTVFEVVDEVIAYSYLVTNSGNVTISGPITIDDDKTTNEACPAGDLAPGDSLTCTSSYTIVAGDLVAGSVTNVASATGADPDANPVTSATDTVTINIAAPALSVDKTSTTATLTAAGTVNYSYLVTNTGNVDLAGISLSDDNDNNDMNCPANALAVGVNMTCTATHTFTQAELDANGSPTPGSGLLSNNVTAVSNKAPNAIDSLTIPITQSPALTVVKTATQATYSAVDDVLDYEYEVTNSGNVTITGPITVADDKTTATCPAGNLAPGGSLTCTSSYTITQADLDAGSVTNVSSASGTDPNAATVTSPDASETVNATQSPALTVAKSVTQASYSTVGDVLDYSYEVTNSGNVTITGPITIDDDQSTDESCPAGDLAPGANLTCTATYTVTQADLDAGSVTNVASASGTDPNAATVTSPTDSETVNAVQNPGLTIVKTATPTTFSAVDDVIDYEYEVTNSGNVTISGPITVDDDKSTDESCPAGDIAPGASMTCTATYTIVAADVTAGSVTNIASASGTDPNAGTVTSPTDDETVTLVP